MSLGESTAEVQAGGGQAGASSSDVARTVVQLCISPGGTPATIYRSSSQGAIVSTHQAGPLAEAAAMRHRRGLTTLTMPINPSVAGGVSAAVAHVGTGTGTIVPTVAPWRLIEVLCDTGGAIGTMKFKYRVNGGAYSDVISSTGSAPFVFGVPGTFTSLSFAAATYVATKVWQVDVAGTVTPGAAWVGTVTPTSSPIDFCDVIATIVKGGLFSDGNTTVRISLDGGSSTLPDLPVPVGGVVTMPNTGLVLTFAGTFVSEDTYAFLAAPPGYSTGDLSTALDALLADRTVECALIHLPALPVSAAAAFTQASTLQTFIDDAFDAGLDWQGAVEGPVVGDIVMSGANAIRDTADTGAVIRAARSGKDYPRVAVQFSTHAMNHSLNRDRKTARPYGWALVDRFVETDPREDLSRKARGPLKRIFAIGWDEANATTTLDDVQINVPRTYRSSNGAFQSITSGGAGWKNLTIQADFQAAGAVRVLNVGVRAIRAFGENQLGEDLATKPNGTIAEEPRRALSTGADDTINLALGMKAGGAFVLPQASSATGEVLESSQLGVSPKRLDIEYDIQTRGFVSSVHSVTRFSGVLSVGG